VHLDLEAMKKTELYRYLTAQNKMADVFNCSLAVDDDKLDLDFTRCHSVTFYGTNLDFSEDSWIGIVKLPNTYRQEILKKLEQFAHQDGGTFRPIKGEETWHGFTLDDVVDIYNPRRDTFVAGKGKLAHQVGKLAADQASTQAPEFIHELAGRPAPFLSVAFSGSLTNLEALPLKLNPTEGATNSYGDLTRWIQLGALQSLKGGSLVVGETTNYLWGCLTVPTQTPESARQMQTALSLILTQSGLLSGGNKNAQNLLENLKVTTDKNALKLSFALPVKTGNQSLYEQLETEFKPAADPKKPKP